MEKLSDPVDFDFVMVDLCQAHAQHRVGMAVEESGAGWKPTGS